MASAIIAGLIKSGHNSKNILVCAPTDKTRNRLSEEYGVITNQDNSSVLKFADVVILSVKPYLIKEVCEELVHASNDDHQVIANKLFMSIAAGVTAQAISSSLNNSPRVVATMPNLPTAIGEGLTGMFAESSCSNTDKATADDIMNAVGSTVWVESENAMPAIVAAAGSSPAYFFLFMEAMVKAAIGQGLDEEGATNAVMQSAKGAIMLAANSPHSFAELRRQVTSPKGATEQAINAFQAGDLDQLVKQAMKSAAAKVEEVYKQI